MWQSAVADSADCLINNFSFKKNAGLDAPPCGPGRVDYGLKNTKPITFIKDPNDNDSVTSDPSRIVNVLNEKRPIKWFVVSLV